MMSGKKINPGEDADTSEPRIVLRNMVSEDLPFLIHIELDPENKKFTLQEELPATADLEQLIRKGSNLNTEGQSRLILEMGAIPVGLADLYDAILPDQNAWIGIIIDKKFRRMGLGLKCLQLLENWAFNKGIRRLNAMVHPLNFPAMALFRSAGYNPYLDKVHPGFSLLKKEILPLSA
jgi:RimJ/RimL family protein N-acetyltransferase